MKILNSVVLVLALVVTPATAGPLDQTDVYCLAENIYHEAGGESIKGQIAVAQVTINRVNSKKFQRTICEVVYAPKQFSWTNNKNKEILDLATWQKTYALAETVINSTDTLPKFSALYFHARQVNPVWNRGMKKVATIGNHVFYK